MEKLNNQVLGGVIAETVIYLEGVLVQAKILFR
jgi:hypothetical protein